MSLRRFGLAAALLAAPATAQSPASAEEAAARAAFVAELPAAHGGGTRFKAVEQGVCSVTIQRFKDTQDDIPGISIPWRIDWRQVRGVRPTKDYQNRYAIEIQEGDEPWIGPIDRAHTTKFVAAAQRLARACGGMK
jgi:hypothetical protein